MKSVLFFLLFAITISGCRKSAEKAKLSVAETVKTGEWMLIYMENKSVVDIGTAMLKFNGSGAFTVTKNGAVYSGTWVDAINAYTNTLTLNIITGDPKLQNLNKDWKVTRITEYFIDVVDSNVAGTASMQLMKH